MQTPFFTIITATYNAAETLPRLLESLSAQSCRDFELVIQDGASRDETLAILERYRDRLPQLFVNSEPDKGLYDAWNKVLGTIRGEWVIFLGADDALFDADTLANVKRIASSLSETVLFAAGDVVICDEEEKLEVQHGLGEDAPDRLRAGSAAMHSGLFQRARVFSKGGFDTSYTITGDHDFVLRHWKQSSDGTRLGFVVTRMGVGGMTSNLGTVFPFRCEFMKVMRKHFGLRAALRFFPGVVKGFVPYLLVRFLGAQKALAVYNKLREIRHLPRAVIK